MTDDTGLLVMFACHHKQNVGGSCFGAMPIQLLGWSSAATNTFCWCIPCPSRMMCRTQSGTREPNPKSNLQSQDLIVGYPFAIQSSNVAGEFGAPSLVTNRTMKRTISQSHCKDGAGICWTLPSPQFSS